jgi:archaemetzincin
VRTILLLPLGNVDLNLVQALRLSLMDVLGLPIKTGKLPVRLEYFYDETRGQYNSTKILLYLKDHYLREGNTSDKILALLGDDLFIPILTFVFGEAELGGSVAVASYHRLQSERYGLSPDYELLIDRLSKEALHELGHTFGLIHCAIQECVMHTSNNVEEVDLKGTSFCAPCMRTISVML